MKNRPERKFSFLVVWLTMFSCISGNGQNMLKKADSGTDFKHVSLPGSHAQGLSPNPRNRAGWDLSREVIFAGVMNPERLYTIPADVYYLQSGYFCKREWELEKTTHIPFRFRLGSLAELDAMEGKH